ncbi:tRNA glutamyl-Q(34) synthetase GluQRS [Pusillimonas caeni]|uniref:tRNA glutamyl-Q(34) synthetase GluQRS n=1 Tax=Pusillimonas caeni TaxID=1348472 RepID=UPI000E59DE18|nr:tRNA glutamyl-Q(34) synthetase GluQRS [Pusillimonas caeni]TFL14473.1 tRNA glutamyl-Q(34) synthetase GluQRS [Pusillimonas caeni]
MVAASDTPDGYVGRFAPSPSGPLHDGSLAAAMASYLDARAHSGRWLLRVEDIDAPRTVPGADRVIMGQLEALGMHWDAPPTWQSLRLSRYQSVFDRLLEQGLVYGCACTRKQLAAGAYPGTCSKGLAPGQRPRAWRVRMPQGAERFQDRWLGPQCQDVAREVGDFIIRRADGLWAYQFVVVIDDGDQGVTDVVRGADLLDSTARQRVLARLLGLQAPRVMHVPLVLDEAGHKLSKQNHAPPLDSRNAPAALEKAWRHLGFDPLPPLAGVADFWAEAVPRWAARFNI